VFDSLASRYDQAYESQRGKSLLAAEIDCLTPLLDDVGRPRLEVGVGTGRFAQALGIEHGVDPSGAMLEYAERRGVNTIQAAGESLPYEDGTFAAALMVFTLCFVESPEEVLSEIKRVLRPGGALIVGIIPANTAWSDTYVRQGKEGNPFYAEAHFYSVAELRSLLKSAGFLIERARSALLLPPDGQPVERDSVEGIDDAAGLVALRCRKRSEAHSSLSQEVESCKTRKQ
jgi:ubiquinone/menaquinone biosynthesis C-methylase UbiE